VSACASLRLQNKRRSNARSLEGGKEREGDAAGLEAYEVGGEKKRSNDPFLFKKRTKQSPFPFQEERKKKGDSLLIQPGKERGEDEMFEKERRSPQCYNHRGEKR